MVSDARRSAWEALAASLTPDESSDVAVAMRSAACCCLASVRALRRKASASRVETVGAPARDGVSFSGSTSTRVFFTKAMISPQKTQLARSTLWPCRGFAGRIPRGIKIDKQTCLKQMTDKADVQND
jgi:hypothetical protein